MWILPKNHYEYSAFVQESGDLSEELKEHWKEADSNSTPLLLLKSKPLLLPTLLRAWKRVYWLRVLCGRTLRPSLIKSFTEKYTASLADIPANPSAMQETGKEKMTQGTSGPILPRVLEQFNLFGASLKMCPDILHSDMKLSGENYKNWVIELRKVYSLRRKSEHHTNVKDSLSSQSWGTPQNRDWKGASGGYQKQRDINYQKQRDINYQVMNWTTPTATDQNQSQKYSQGGTPLSFQVKNWPSPTVSDIFTGNMDSSQQKEGSMHSVTLPQAVNKGWPTPTANDFKGGGSNDTGRDRLDYATEKKKTKHNSLQDQENNNMNGKKREQLNPAWVAQLMGTTLGKTFFVPMVTESWIRARN